MPASSNKCLNRQRLISRTDLSVLSCQDVRHISVKFFRLFFIAQIAKAIIKQPLYIRYSAFINNPLDTFKIVKQYAKSAVGKLLFVCPSLRVSFILLKPFGQLLLFKYIFKALNWMIELLCTNKASVTHKWPKGLRSGLAFSQRLYPAVIWCFFSIF